MLEDFFKICAQFVVLISEIQYDLQIIGFHKYCSKYVGGNDI